MRQFALALMMTLALCGMAKAQQPAPADAGTPQTTADSLASLVEVMKDERLRNQLIGHIEELRRAPPVETVPSASAQPQPQPAAPAAAVGTAAEDGEDAGRGAGLVAALVDSVRELGGRLPTAALGAPVDVKIVQAHAQIERRLAAPEAGSQLQSFGIKSLAGWAVITVAALFTLFFVRRRIRARIERGVGVASLVREAGLRALLGFLPLVLCLVIASIWSYLLGYGAQGRSIFVLLSMPFISAVVTSELTACLLLPLVRTKGWRIVAYAQKRLAPLVGVLTGLAVAASLATVPEIRIAIGPATADIASLILDLAVPMFALYIVLKHRRTVRTLIVRGRHIDEHSTSWNRATFWVATHWHLLGVAFVVLNVGARLFGARNGGFLSQSFFSVAIIVIALIISAALGRFMDLRISRRRRRPVGARMQEVVVDRFGSMLFRLVRVALTVGAVIACLGLWGVDVISWFGSREGGSVFQSIFSIVSVILVAWALWVILDAWISDVLSPSTERQRSARVLTLLPLLRNIAFVALSALTIIGVLSNLGINVAPLIAGAGVVGLAVGFGSQQLVQDVITGLFMLLEDTIAIGDVVDTGDRAGTVEGMTIRTVKIRDGDGALHSIPFSTIKALKNSSRGFGVYTATVTLDVQADVAEAIRIFKSVGDDVRANPAFASKIVAPLDVWGVDQVGLDGVVLKGAIKTLPLQQWGVGREINRLFKEKLQAAGIRLATRTNLGMATAAA